jgi:hypothetical protein
VRNSPLSVDSKRFNEAFSIAEGESCKFVLKKRPHGLIPKLRSNLLAVLFDQIAAEVRLEAYVGRVASVRACYIAGMRFFAKEDWVLYSWRPLSMRTRVRIWIRENLRERGLRPMNVVIADLVRDWFGLV